MFGSSRFLTCCGALCLAAGAAWGKPKELQQRSAEAGEGPGYWVSLSYDGSQHRRASWSFIPSVAFSLTEDIQAGTYLNAVTGSGLHWQWSESLFAGVWSSLDLGEWMTWSWEAEAELSGPSLISDRGLDVQLTLTGARSFGEEDEWFCGAALGSLAATSPFEGDRIGFVSLSAWAGRQLGLLDYDALSAGFYAATHETPGFENLFTIEGRYQFNLREQLEITLSLGKEISSPFDHDSYYAGFLATWEF
jgi:hypothetical protein